MSKNVEVYPHTDYNLEDFKSMYLERIDGDSISFLEDYLSNREKFEPSELALKTAYYHGIYKLDNRNLRVVFPAGLDIAKIDLGLIKDITITPQYKYSRIVGISTAVLLIRCKV